MDASSALACRICGGRDGNTTYTARERMFGMGDEFLYVRCGTCGCQQIADVPESLSRYYPANYYSFAPTRLRGIRRVVTTLRNRSYFRRGLGIGTIVRALLPHASLAAIARLRLSRDARILDVGCGYGELLMELHGMGFRHLRGVDPFTAADAEPLPGLRVRKASIESLPDEPYDLIMLHHVFEHVPDPLGTLRAVSRLLAPGGCCLIRVPVASSWASTHYGPLWVQHDAPRHLFLHTEQSLSRAAAEVGLSVTDVVYDSTEFRMWGSELYRQGIALASVPLGEYGNPLRRLLSPTFRRYRREARRLNAQRLGDQAAFYLRRPDSLAPAGVSR